MTQINAFNPAAVTYAATAKADGVKALENTPLRMADGVTGLFSKPLGAGEHSFGKLCGEFKVKCGHLHDCMPPRSFCHPHHDHCGPRGHHHHHHHDYGHHHHHHHHHHHNHCDNPRPRGQWDCTPGDFPPKPKGGDCQPKPWDCEPKIWPPIIYKPRIDCDRPPNVPDIRIPDCWDLPNPKVSWTAKMTGENTAKIDLGDGYKLDINEKNSEMTIINEKTGEKTRIWGDPHVDVDGKRAFDFWGTSTFTLENGTKITINTEQWKGNPNMYVASQVLITKGDNAIVVDGISQNKLGDLSVTMSNNGEAIDAANRDGWTVHENATGSGWRTEAGNIATQKDANVTKVGAEYGPGSTALSQGEAVEQFAELLFNSFASQLGNFLLFGAVVNSLIDMVGGNAGNDNRADRQRDFNPIRPLDSVLL